MEGPCHVSLPALGQDLAVPLDDLAEQADLGGVPVDDLHLLGLEAQYEVTALRRG